MSLLGSITTFAVRNNWWMLARVSVSLGAMFGTDFTSIRVEDQQTLWHICNNKSMGEILLPVAKSTINEKDAAGKTALHIAAEGSSAAYIKFLEANGCNILQQDKNGNFAIDYATKPRPARRVVLDALYNLAPNLQIGAATRQILFELGIIRPTNSAVDDAPVMAVPVALEAPSPLMVPGWAAHEKGLQIHGNSSVNEITTLVNEGANIFVKCGGRTTITSLQRNNLPHCVMALIDAVAEVYGSAKVTELINTPEDDTQQTPLDIAQNPAVISKLINYGGQRGHYIREMREARGNYPKSRYV